jgi:hypothetical protein
MGGLTELADQLLRSARQISDGWRSAALSIPAVAFGDEFAGEWLHDVHEETVDDADRALNRLTGVLELDVDRVLQVAFAYSAADANAAGRFAITPV